MQMLKLGAFMMQKAFFKIYNRKYPKHVEILKCE